MKSNIVIFWILTSYFFLIAAVYTVWNLIEHGYVEWAGTTAITLSGALTAFIATYLQMVQKKQGGALVEDREDSDIDDGDPELGEVADVLGLRCVRSCFGSLHRVQLLVVLSHAAARTGRHCGLGLRVLPRQLRPLRG